jgi:hypothetical protein
MKTFFTLLQWVFGIYAFTFIFSGIFVPAISGGLESPEYGFFLFFLSIPFALLALFFRNMGKKREWDDDFFYLLFKFSSSKGKELKTSLKTGIEESKEKMKKNTND